MSALNQKCSILLVDDNPANLLALEAVLESVGETLVRAMSGTEAIELIRDNEFAAVLLDVQMPGIDGFDTAMAMRKMSHLRKTPVILLTAGDLTEENIRRAYAEGASDILRKPYSPDILRGKVRVFVDLYKQSKEVERQARELRLTQKALRQSRDFYLTLFENFPAMIWRAGPDAKCNYFNRTWVEFTGRTMEEDMGDGWIGGVHPDDKEKCLATYTTHFELRQPFQMEYRLKHHSGEYRWIFDKGSPFHDLEGSFAGYVGACYDLTARKQAEDEVRKLNVELEERVAQRTSELQNTIKELEAFSYSISHDLRTPLRSINAFSRLLIEEELENLKPESRRFLTLISQGAVTMGNLIDDLLAFSRLGRQPVEKQPFPMREVVEDVLNDLQIEYEGRNVEFNLNGFGNAYGDRILIKQVWINLISNALKFTTIREHAVIQLGSEVTEEGEVWYIRDNGVGFDMKYSEKLFGVFQRLHRPDEFEGSGVGLAIAHRIVSRHGGRIWVKAEKNAGATFYFTLPPV